MFSGVAAIALGSCLSLTTTVIYTMVNSPDPSDYGNNLAFAGVGLTGQLLSALGLVSDISVRVHLLIMIFYVACPDTCQLH